MVDEYDDHDERDFGYGDTDVDDTNDDGFGDDTVVNLGESNTYVCSLSSLVPKRQSAGGS